MRIETILKICKVLGISPNDVLMEDDYNSSDNFDLDKEMKQISERLKMSTIKEQRTALSILSVYLNSLS